MTNGQGVHIAWVQRDGSVPGGWAGMLQDFTTLFRTTCNLEFMNSLFLECFHLIFLDHGFPQITEAGESETADKGGATILH